MQPKLVATAGPLAGHTFPLPESDGAVGRGAGVWLTIKSPTVSRHHFRVENGEGAWRVVDLESRNGTYVNEERVTARALAHGDRIRAGEAEFLFVMEEEEQASAADPPVESIPTRTVFVHSGESSFLRPWSGSAAAERRLNALLRIGAAAQAAAGVEEVERCLSEHIQELMPAVSVELRGGSSLESGILSEEDHNGVSQATIHAPLKMGPRCLGTLTIRSADGLTRDHLDLAVAVGTLLAGPLDHLWRIEQLEQDLRRVRSEGAQEYEFIGDSPLMDRIYAMIRKVAPTDTTVLLTGENGTGKELAARAIHRMSGRAAGPFIAVNCATLKDALMESEMFGHEKGAFTGAVVQRKGRVEMAEGGTLFLDEIGELQLPLQAKLLRLIQERQFERLGGSRSLKADVRFVAATNRDLKQEILAGRFREDLFYRLKVVALELPPLRDRRDDIPLLVSHFIGKAAFACKRKVFGISPAAREVLLKHDWPGNVRELQNAIERAVVLGSGEWIEVEDLPEDLLETPPSTELPAFHDVVRDAKRRQIVDAI
ncbi:MAG: sigma 54-dependent Fis family transcriptional regulator, partial [Bryobacterales bacterium]|nr:sigma 54-dependent Fis family transcriptional regulator [Bryobacterales bacterium]